MGGLQGDSAGDYHVQGGSKGNSDVRMTLIEALMYRGTLKGTLV